MRNVAVIDLRTLSSNAKKIKDVLPEKVKFCAVVKADAYGHGACACAAALYKTADCYAVALVEEGIELRLSGIDKEIIVLIPAANKELDRAVEYGLSLTVASESDIAAAERAGRRLKRKVNVHVAVNTGMNRLGANLCEIDGICERLNGCAYVKAVGVFSHFACPENRKRRKTALEIFRNAFKKLQRINPAITRHISASGGFLCGEYFDMVRIGILLYGYKPFKSDFPVKPIMRVYSRTVKRRKVKKGELALYGNVPLKEDCEFSMVRAGYADGFFRKKTDGLINNRCMDTSGIIGRFNGVLLSDADALSSEYGTISYEILCAATVRAEKKYVR